MIGNTPKNLLQKQKIVKLSKLYFTKTDTVVEHTYATLISQIAQTTLNENESCTKFKIIINYISLCECIINKSLNVGNTHKDLRQKKTIVKLSKLYFTKTDTFVEHNYETLISQIAKTTLNENKNYKKLKGLLIIYLCANVLLTTHGRIGTTPKNLRQKQTIVKLSQLY